MDCYECHSSLVQEWSDMLQSEKVRNEINKTVIDFIDDLTTGKDANLYRGLNQFIAETVAVYIRFCFEVASVIRKKCLYFASKLKFSC